MEIKAFLLLLICAQLSICKSLDDDSCEDWAAFKDEKCLKIFDKDLLSYTDAENICKNEDGALLPIINTEEKQSFIEDMLKSQNVVDNVWIGLKYVNESYVWADGTPADYVHWASGSPTNDSNYCVQIETEKTEFGYWADIACTKKNLVICEKLQLWPLSKLQSTVKDMLKELSNVVKNPVPIGFIYQQLPKEKSPQEVWSGLEWKDVSSDYAGLFFRTEGGDSASFGEIQDESSPRLTAVRHYTYGPYPSTQISVPPNGKESTILFSGYENLIDDILDNTETGLSFQLSKEEVCPRNTAIRIWKRTL